MRVALGVVAFGTVIALTEWALRVFRVPRYIVPPPSVVFRVVVNRYALLFRATGITMTEAIAGFLLGNLGAYTLAVAFIRFPHIERYGLVAAVAVKATPVVVLAPLFIIWFGNGPFGKCLMASIVCFFPMLVNAIVGLRAAEPEIIDYLRSLGASETQILFRVRIQTSLPYVMAAAKTSSTISIVGAIIAELSGSDSGIGHIFLVSIYQVETDVMFAAIAFIAIAGILLYRLIELPERYLERRGLVRFAAATG